MRVELRITTNLHNIEKRINDDDTAWHIERINTDHITRDYVSDHHYFYLANEKYLVHPDDVEKLEDAMKEKAHWIDRLFDRWGWK